MQFAFLTLLIGVAIAEFVITQRLSFGGLALLYVFLRLQADRSATLFAKYGLAGKPRPPWEEAAEQEPWVTPEKDEPRSDEAEAAAATDAEEDPEQVHVSQFKRKTPGRHYYGPRPTEREKPRLLAGPEQPAQARPARAARPAPAAEPVKPVHQQPKGLYQTPRFHGAPHEVLGVTADAGTRQIVHAYRFWMKKYHPDHAPAGETQSATERARQLTQARDSLLRTRRRKSRSQSAA